MDIQKLYTIYLEHPDVTTDSRRCPEGSIFFALKGDSFDGNRFAAVILDAEEYAASLTVGERAHRLEEVLLRSVATALELG